MSTAQPRFDLQIDVNSNADAGYVRIQSKRPVHASAVFANRTLAEVGRVLPMMFHVCATAQAAAAISAIEAALRADAGLETIRARRRLVVMEAAREHLLRVFLDWPAHVGATRSGEIAARVMPLIDRLHDAQFESRCGFTVEAEPEINRPELDDCVGTLGDILDSHVFGMPHRQWLTFSTYDELVAWARSNSTVPACLLCSVLERDWGSDGAIEARFLPALDADDLERRFTAEDAARFVEQPDWKRGVFETGPLERQRLSPPVAAMHGLHGHGLASRLVAVLAELAAAPRSVSTGAASAGRVGHIEQTSPADRVGIAQVEAARGRLVHRVALIDDRVSRYQILAPTEWNFHPAGAAVSALATLPENHLRERAELLIASIDPCVAFELRVH